jgi:hypothetical protein
MAEIAQDQGAASFAVIDKDVERNVRYFGSGYDPFYPFGWYGHGFDDDFFPYWPGFAGPTRYDPITSYTAIGTMRLVLPDAEVPSSATVFDAAEVRERLKPQIMLPQAAP